MNKIKRVIISTGGSGGHVFPGLVVARYLINKGHKVMWVGTSNHIEASVVPQNGIKIKFIHVIGLYGKKFYVKIIAILFVVFSVYRALKIIKNWKPDVMLGMGGYVSIPSCLAAWICRVPLVIHEQNKVIGLTNRFLSIFSKKILWGFTGKYPVGFNIVVGNPIRDTILSIPDPAKRWRDRSGPIRVLVMGGSQGSLFLNKIMPIVAANLLDKLDIWHIVGEKNIKSVMLDYNKYQQNSHKIVAFVDNIAQAYAWADILVARSGALTVSEVAVVGLPAIFVPFRYHQNYHQYWNAMSLVQIGAARIVKQEECASNIISKMLQSWNRKMLLNMAQRAKILTIPHATQSIVQTIVNCCSKK